MTVEIEADLDAGDVVLVDMSRRQGWGMTPDGARRLADECEAALAVSAGHVLVHADGDVIHLTGSGEEMSTVVAALREAADQVDASKAVLQ